jgi:hypothetical protein
MRANIAAIVAVVAVGSLIAPLVAQDLPSTPQAVRQRLSADFYRKRVVLRRPLYSLETPTSIGLTTTSPNHGVMYQVALPPLRTQASDRDVTQLFTRLSAVDPTWRLAEYPAGTTLEVRQVEWVNGDLRLPLFRSDTAGLNADTTLTVYWGISTPSDGDTYLGIERLIAEFLTVVPD